MVTKQTRKALLLALLMISQVAFTYDLVQEVKNYFMIEDYHLDYLQSLFQFETEVLESSHNTEKKKLQVISGKTLDDICEPQGENCVISNQHLRFADDLHWQPIGLTSLKIQNSQISCQDKNDVFCYIFFDFSLQMVDLSIEQYSLLKGNPLVIYGDNLRVTIDSTSHASSSGTSHAKQGLKANQGASYIAMGGQCGTKEKDNVYGVYENLPNFDNPTKSNDKLEGSIGQRYRNETAGGGRIIFLIESLSIQQEAGLQANGYPLESHISDETLQGGSGGYIFINTTNNFQTNDINIKGSIQAIGGSGLLGGHSGSGGIVQIDSWDSAILDTAIVVRGGFSMQQTPANQDCSNGGAGVKYFITEDVLFLDNDNMNTTQYTLIRPDLETQEFPYMVIVQSRAHIELHNLYKWFIFNYMYIDNYCNFKLGQYSSDFTVYFKQDVYFSPGSKMDFSDDTKVITLDGGDYGASLYLGQIEFENELHIIGQNLYLDAELQLSNTSYKDSVVKMKGIDTLTLTGNSKILSDHLYLQGNNVDIQAGANITSLTQNECNSFSRPDYLFPCIPRDFPNRTLTEEDLNTFYTEETGDHKHTFIDSVSENFNIYVLAFTKLNLNSVHVEGPRIGFCASDMDLLSSEITTDGHGCEADDGKGKGDQVKDCAGSGGAHGGNGGYGGVDVPGWDDKEEMKCEANFPEAVELPEDELETAIFEGSGGGSGKKSDSSGGSGGGIVWLSAANNINMHKTRVSSQGGYGNRQDGDTPGSGGGAGGSIQIITHALEGDGTVTVAGGHGSYGGGGGGSGGRFIMAYLSYYVHDHASWQNYKWKGNLYLGGGQSGPVDDGGSKGQAGEQGGTWSRECIGGYSGPLCTPCGKGFYKYDFSYATCSKCVNKPHNAYYDKVGQDQANCSYECLPAFQPVSVNPKCLNDEDLEIERIGGRYPAMAIFSLFMLLGILFWVTFINKHSEMQDVVKHINEHLFDEMWQPPTKYNSVINEASFNMKDHNIWSHVHRMYLIGQNSINFPWLIPRDFPVEGLEQEHKDQLIKFISKKQIKHSWNQNEKSTFFLYKLICPAFASNYHLKTRKRHYSSLQHNLYYNFDDSFWNYEATQKTMRLGVSDIDYQLAYIDFLDFSKTQQNYKGFKLPITLLFSGNGTFNNPWIIDYEQDPLAKSLILIQKDYLKKKLPLFYENLNTKIARLSFYHFTRVTMHDLSDLMEWIEFGNKQMFNQFGVKATLYLIENSYVEVDRGLFKQKRKSFPLEPLVFETFPELQKRMVQQVKNKMFEQLYEVRMALVFRKHSEGTERLLEERITKCLQTKKDMQDGKYEDGGEYENLIFAKDIYESEEIVEQKKEEPGQTTFLQRTDYLGTPDQQPHSVQTKFVSRASRSFSISQESSKAYELTLQKTRNTAMDKLQGAMQSMYSLWLLLLKPIGTASEDWLYFKFFMYSNLVAMDVALLVSMLMHCFVKKYEANYIWVPFLCSYPLLTIIYPMYAIVGIFRGSPKIMKKQMELSTYVVMSNYLSTLSYQILAGDEHFYIMQTCLLILNKVFMGYFASDIRQCLLNPNFEENQQKLENEFNISENDKQREEFADFGLVGEEQLQNLEAGRPINSHLVEELDVDNSQSLAGGNALNIQTEDEEVLDQQSDHEVVRTNNPKTPTVNTPLINQLLD